MMTQRILIIKTLLCFSLETNSFIILATLYTNDTSVYGTISSSILSPLILTRWNEIAVFLSNISLLIRSFKNCFGFDRVSVIRQLQVKLGLYVVFKKFTSKNSWLKTSELFIEICENITVYVNMYRECNFRSIYFLSSIHFWKRVPRLTLHCRFLLEFNCVFNC